MARPRVIKPIRYVTSSDFNSGGQKEQRENVNYTRARNQQGRLTEARQTGPARILSLNAFKETKLNSPSCTYSHLSLSSPPTAGQIFFFTPRVNVRN